MLLGGMRVLCDTGTAFDSNHASTPYYETLRLTLLVCKGFEWNTAERKQKRHHPKCKRVIDSHCRDSRHSPRESLPHFTAVRLRCRPLPPAAPAAVAKCPQHASAVATGISRTTIIQLRISHFLLLSFSISYFHLSTK